MAGSSNAVQIVIQATDNASGIIKRTTDSLRVLQQSASATLAPLKAMGATLQIAASAGQAGLDATTKALVGMGVGIGNTVGTFVTFFNTLYQGFSNIVQLVETFRTNDAIQVFLAKIAERADEAIGRFQYDIAGAAEGVGQYGSALLSGLGSTFDKTNAQVQEVEETAKAIVPVFDSVKTAIYSTFDGIGAKADQLSLSLKATFLNASLGQGFLVAQTVATAAIDTIRDHATVASFYISQALNGSVLARGFNIVKVLGTVAFDEIASKASAVGQIIKLSFEGTLTGRVFNVARVLAQTAFDSIGEQIGKVAEKFEAFKNALARPVQPPAVAVDPLTAAFAQLEGTSVRTASKFSTAFMAATEQVKVGVNQVGAILGGTFNKLERLPDKISSKLAVGSQIAGFLGANDAIDIFGKIKEGTAGIAGTVFQATQELGQFGLGISALQGLVQGGPFQLLIGQNVQLQEQLLATKASLVSTNQIMQNGREIKDPTAAIQSLEAPVDQAIQRLRTISLDLVGVTSKDLVPVYQLVAGYASQIGVNLDQVADITASAAAAMGTLNIPLFQARQEVGSILSGTIDMNSVLAKSLGITNQQVATWKSQGRVYQELTTKLEAFRAGNKLASETINGYTSNIQELFDIIGQKAGAQLLAPITKELGSLYNYLKDNQEALVEFSTSVIGSLLEGAQAVAQSIGQVFKLAVPIGANTILIFADAAKEAMLALANAIKILTPIFQPLVSLLGVLSSQSGLVIVPLLQMAITMKTAQFAIGGLSAGFGTFTRLVPGLGEVLALTTGRGNSLIRTLGGLAPVFGKGGASALLFGQNLAMIPGGAGLVASGIGKISPILGLFGGQIAGVVPQLSTFAIRAAALAKDIPAVGNAFGAVLPYIKANSGELTKMAQNYAPLVDKLIPGFSEKVIGLTKAVAENADAGKLRNLVDEKTVSIVTSVGQSLGKTVVKWAVISAAVYIAYQAFDRFILKNKELMEAIEGAFSGISGILSGVADGIFSAFSGIANVIGGLVGSITSLFGAAKNTGQRISDFLTAPITLAAIAIVGLIAAGEKIALLQSALTALNMTGAAAGAVQASAGIQSLKIAFTQGAVAAAEFQAANNISAKSLKTLWFELQISYFTMKQWILETTTAAIAMGQKFVVSAYRMVAALIATAVNSVRSALAMIFLGKTADATGNSLNFAAIKTKLVAFWTNVLGPACAKGALGLQTLAAGAWSAASGFLALAAPLVIIGGLLAVAGLTVYTAGLKAAGESADVLGQQTNFISSRNLTLAQSLKSAQKAQEEKTKAGIRLTDEEYNQNKKLAAQAKLQIQDTESQLANLKQQQSSAPSQYKGQYDAMIADLEATQKLLKSQVDNVQISAKELPRLGTAYEQFGQQAATALEAIRNPSGETDKYKEQAKTLLDATQAELKGNLITADEAIGRFQLLATNAGIDKETQIKAREEITAARKIANDKDLADLTAQESKVKTLQSEGKLGEAEAERQLSKVKKQELDQQLEDLKQNKADADKIRADDTNKRLAENATKVADAEKALAAAQGDPAAVKETIDRQQNELKSGRAQTVAQIQGVEAEISQLQASARGKRGNEAAQADSKVADLKKQLLELNQGVGKTDDQLSALDKQAKTPVTPGNVNQDEVKAKQAALKALQVDRFKIEKESETASKDSARQFDNDKAKIDEGRAKQEADDRKKTYDQKLLFQDEEQKILESKLATKKITEEKFNVESLKTTKVRLDTELAEVNRQRALLPKSDTDGLKKLAAQEADINKRRFEADEKFFLKRQELRLNRQDSLQKIADAQFTMGLISEENYSEQSLKITRKRLDTELEEVNRQRALLPKSDTDGLKKLEAQEADINKRRFEAEEKFYQKRQELQLKHQDNLQKIADAQLATGLISEEAYSDQSLEITNKRLDVELQEIARQRKKLAAGDTERALALDAQEADVSKKRVEALEKFVQQKTAILERAEKKALDIAQLAAVQRDTQLQDLRNKNLIQDDEANVKQVDSDRDRLNAQLAAETELADKLERLPKPSDPIKESERQAQIRGSRLKTAEATKQIIENEGKRQEAHTKLLQALIDRALKDKQNAIESERQKTQKLLDLQDKIAESLEFQNKILESRKALEQSISDYANGEFSLAASLTKSAYEKEQIEKRQAEARLIFLDRQQQLERRSLESDIEKNKALLEREKIQLRLDQLSAAGETADKKAELDKVNADPKASTRQKKAAELAVQNASYKEDLLGYKGEVLNFEGKRQETDASSRREALGNKQELEYDGARADYATKSKNIGLQNQLKQEFLQKGNNAVNNFYTAADQTERPKNRIEAPDFLAYMKSRGRNLDPNAPATSFASTSQPTQAATNQPNQATKPPTLTVPGLAPDQAGGISQLAGAIAKFNQDMLDGFAKMANITPSITQKNEINNYTSGSEATSGNVGAKVSQDVLNGLYSVLQLAKQRQTI